jgi:hypothetical protein
MDKWANLLRKEEEPTHTLPSGDDTGKLAEAAESVYRRYGTDLKAFFRDAFEADAKRREQERVARHSHHDVEVCP